MSLKDEPELLFANDTFYAAFANGDFAAMDALWTHTHHASCIHPGGPIIHGRTMLLESWRGILKGDHTIDITPHDATPMVVGDVGWVTCLECIGDSTLAATNIFARENGMWKMIHHQASPTDAHPEDDTPSPAQAH